MFIVLTVQINLGAIVDIDPFHIEHLFSKISQFSHLDESLREVIRLFSSLVTIPTNHRNSVDGEIFLSGFLACQVTGSIILVSFWIIRDSSKHSS